jgi:hypothetical protein
VQIRIALNLKNINDFLYLFDLFSQNLLIEFTRLELFEILINQGNFLNDVIDCLFELSDPFSKLICVLLDVGVRLPLNLQTPHHSSLGLEPTFSDKFCKFRGDSAFSVFESA